MGLEVLTQRANTGGRTLEESASFFPPFFSPTILELFFFFEVLHCHHTYE